MFFCFWNGLYFVWFRNDDDFFVFFKLVTTLPSKKLPKKLTVLPGEPEPIPFGHGDGDYADHEKRSGQILWIRGLTRLQTQVRCENFYCCRATKQFFLSVKNENYLLRIVYTQTNKKKLYIYIYLLTIMFCCLINFCNNTSLTKKIHSHLKIICEQNYFKNFNLFTVHSLYLRIMCTNKKCVGI